MSNWAISENQLDDIQTQIILKDLNKDIMVQGCAGSGKTILALLILRQKLYLLRNPNWALLSNKESGSAENGGDKSGTVARHL